MPFTPFHMGPLLGVKLLGGRHVSLTVLGLSQVLIDVEVLVRMKLGSRHLHGISNTLTGAVLIGAVTMAIGPLFVRLAHGALNAVVPAESLRLAPRISWRTAAISAFVGTVSHILLDAIMHADAEPFAPLTSANPLLRLVSVRRLHGLCLGAGGLAAIGLAVRWFAATRTAERTFDPDEAGPRRG